MELPDNQAQNFRFQKPSTIPSTTKNKTPQIAELDFSIELKCESESESDHSHSF